MCVGLIRSRYGAEGCAPQPYRSRIVSAWPGMLSPDPVPRPRRLALCGRRQVRKRAPIRLRSRSMRESLGDFPLPGRARSQAACSLTTIQCVTITSKRAWGRSSSFCTTLRGEVRTHAASRFGTWGRDSHRTALPARRARAAGRSAPCGSRPSAAPDNGWPESRIGAPA